MLNIPLLSIVFHLFYPVCSKPRRNFLPRADVPWGQGGAVARSPLLLASRKPHPPVLGLQHQFWHEVLPLIQCLASLFILAPCQEMTIEQLRHKAERV